MELVYRLILRWPGRCVVAFLVVLIGVSALPASWLTRLTPWDQSPDWARLVLQFGALVVVLVGGVIPIAKWYEDRVNRIKEDKPIVVTDLVDGGYQIRNVGNSPAVNVWLLVAEQEAPVALGSLDTHQERRIPESAATLLKQARNGGHVLLAAARPATLRPYTVTLNAQASQDSAVRHGFCDRPTEEQLRRGGSIEEYLQQERPRLARQLHGFAG